jgi:hypothetical protein
MTIKRTIGFEFRIFPADDYGAMNTADERTEWHDLADINAARNKAGTLSKQNNGPVDLAYAGDEPWNDRYITTASPCEHSAKGFRHERLA